MHRFSFAILGMTSLLLGIATVQAKDRDKAATRACQDAVTRKVQKQESKARRVEFLDSSTKVTRLSDSETSVKGTGQFTGKSDDSTKFSYRCTYDASSRDTSSVDVHMQVSDTGSGAGGTYDKSGQKAVNACEKAVERDIRKDNKHVDDIDFVRGKTKIEPQKNAKTNVSGKGEYDKKGKTHKFSYRCTHNDRTGVVQKVEVND